MGALFAGAFSFPFPFVLHQRAAFPHRSISVVTFPFIPHLARVAVPVHSAPRTRTRSRSPCNSHADRTRCRSRSFRTSHAYPLSFTLQLACRSHALPFPFIPHLAGVSVSVHPAPRTLPALVFAPAPSFANL